MSISLHIGLRKYFKWFSLCLYVFFNKEHHLLSVLFDSHQIHSNMPCNSWPSKILIGSICLLVSILFYYQEHLYLYHNRFLNPHVTDCSTTTILPSGIGIRQMFATHLTHGRLIYFPGKEEPTSNFETLLTQITERMNVRGYIVDYRGFGCGQGWLPPNGLTDDVIAAIQYVIHHEALLGIEQQPLFLFGRDIGASGVLGALNTCPAINIRTSGIILEDPWTNLSDYLAAMASRTIPWVGNLSTTLHWITQSRYDNEKLVRWFPGDVMILSSDRNSAFEWMARRVFTSSLSSQKEFVPWHVLKVRGNMMPESVITLIEFVNKSKKCNPRTLF